MERKNLTDIQRKTGAIAASLSQELCDYPTGTKLPSIVTAAEPDRYGQPRFDVKFMELSEAQVRFLLAAVKKLG